MSVPVVVQVKSINDAIKLRELNPNFECFLKFTYDSNLDGTYEVTMTLKFTDDHSCDTVSEQQTLSAPYEVGAVYLTRYGRERSYIGQVQFRDDCYQFWDQQEQCNRHYHQNGMYSLCYGASDIVAKKIASAQAMKSFNGDFIVNGIYETNGGTERKFVGIYANSYAFVDEVDNQISIRDKYGIFQNGSSANIKRFLRMADK